MKKYQIIYADPPWQFQAGGGRKPPYPVMKIKEIYDLPVLKLTDKNCILFLWATYPHLEYCLETIKKWGFKFKTVAFTWVKTKNGKYPIGTGYWTRANPEICLLATKGNIKRKSAKIRNLIISERGRHSEKPIEVRKRIIELVGDLPRIELFARKPKGQLFEDKSFDGWDVWGNEVESDIEL